MSRLILSGWTKEQEIIWESKELMLVKIYWYSGQNLIQIFNLFEIRFGFTFCSLSFFQLFGLQAAKAPISIKSQNYLLYLE